MEGREGRKGAAQTEAEALLQVFRRDLPPGDALIHSLTTYLVFDPILSFVRRPKSCLTEYPDDLSLLFAAR